jgi:hypothetical protein
MMTKRGVREARKRVVFGSKTEECGVRRSTQCVDVEVREGRFMLQQ